MTRLPTVGSDNNTWATILNSFLQVGHNATGTLIGVPNVFNVKDDLYGAKGDITTNDTTAIQAAINACQSAGGGIVFFPLGIYKITSPLTITVSKVRLAGCGIASAILIDPTFSGAAAIIVTSASDGGIRDLYIKGNSTTYSSNPAADGIQIITSSNWVLDNVRTNYVNGWGFKVSNSNVANSFFPFLNACYTEQCKNGFYFLGDTSNNSMGAYLVNCNADQTQVGDCFLFENIYDATATNLEGYVVTGAGTGSFIHIKGSAFIYLSTLDGGANSTSPSMLIESGTSGHLSNISTTTALLQRGSVGLSITGGTEIEFTGCEFYRNYTHGASVTGGADVIFQGCSFGANGQTAGASHYDLNSTTTSLISAQGCTFLSPQGTGSGQVQFAASFNGSDSYAFNNFFKGANGGNTFASNPSIARGNVGYNPLGVQGPPSIPTSGSDFFNPYGVDCTVFVTGGTVSAIAIAGSNTGLTSGTFRIPAGQKIKLTYTVSPSWTWFGD